MSGLEPIAALSLACNILQVIGIGRETVRVAKQVYQDGALDPTLTEHANVLDELSSRIHSTTAAVPATKPKAQDQRLLDLANKCQRAAQNLTEEIKFLNGPPNQATLVATLKIAAKTTWRKRRLERLEKDLQDAENLLQTGLLTAIYQRSLATNDALVSLGVDLRAFIDEYRAGNTRTTDFMKKCIATESKRSEEAVKSHVTQTTSKAEDALRAHIDVAFRGVADREQDAKLDARGERLLRSLKFDRMNERRNTVSPAHTDTLAWVLQDGSGVDGSQNADGVSDTGSYDGSSDTDSGGSSYDARSWDSFSNWLRSTDTTYWISGKPGSGKTTLMKYILNQEKTRAYLDKWVLNPVLISHFFWRPGTKMQQSIRGLLCSMLHQLLSSSPAAVSQVLHGNDAMLTKDSETDWSDEELQRVLYTVMDCYLRPIALFLDGLDEVLPKDGVLRLFAVIDKFKELYAHPGKLKMCLGSRREPLLLQKLGVYPQLRLEQLNYNDLWRYCRAHIVIPPEYQISMSATFRLHHKWMIYSQERPPNLDELKTWLITSLVWKAEGVFLWLCLTTTTIMEAIHEGDTVKDLECRIESLPEDLADLYSDMWTRVNNNKHQKVRAASYLQLALSNDQLFHPFDMMVATTPGMTDVLFAPGTSIHISAQKLVEACEETIRQMSVRCAGILVSPTPKVSPYNEEFVIPWYGDEYRRLLPYISRRGTCSFLHRTAKDFLTDTETGKEILSWGGYSGDSARLKRLECGLARCSLFRLPAWQHHHYLKTVEELVNPWGSLLEFLQELPIEPYNEDNHTDAGVARLLLLAEHFFYRGLLSGRDVLPPLAHRLEETRIGQGIRIAYTSPTVTREHEFLLEAASNSNTGANIWGYILTASKQRNIDAITIQQLFTQACHFQFDYEAELLHLKLRLKHIQSLMFRGGSPCCKTLSRSPTPKSYLIMRFETPFKVLMQSVWGIISIDMVSERLARDLLGLACLFITHGANLREELHIAIGIVGRGIAKFGRIRNLFDNDKQKQEGNSLCIVAAYPASAILVKLLQLGQLTDLPQVDSLLEVTKESFSQGRPIAIFDYNGNIHRSSDFLSVDYGEILSTENVYPLDNETGMEEAFLRFVRAAEKGLQGAVCKVSIPLELQAGVVGAFERLKSGNVPVTERRREVRIRLGIETELEGLDWVE